MIVQKALILAFAVLSLTIPTIARALEDENLEYKKWYVESIGDFNAHHLGHAIFESGKIRGVSTCNIFSGIYSLKDENKIKFFRIGVGGYDTKAVCSIGNKMEMEEKFIDGLETVTNYRINENKLILFKAEGEEFAKFFLKKKK